MVVTSGSSARARSSTSEALRIIDSGSDQILKHLLVIAFGNLFLQTNGLNELTPAGDHRDHAAPAAAGDFPLGEFLLQVFHFLLQLLCFFHHLADVAKAEVRLKAVRLSVRDEAIVSNE